MPTSIQAFSLATLLLLSTNVLSADQQVTADDGSEILLKENGSWEYRSADRFANTEDGRRVRLKQDGSWSYAGNIPLKTQQQVRTPDLDIKLKKVVIETYRTKTQKNSRNKTQTVFYIHLNNSQQAKTEIDIERKDLSLIEVKDNNGKIYPVLSIKADIKSLEYGKGITVVVRAEKSPSILDDARSMKIILKAGIFGIQKPVTLSWKTVDFEKEDVDGFK